MAWWKCRCRRRSSRSTRKLSPFACARTNSGRPCAGKALSAALESVRGRSGPAVAALCSAHRDRSGLSDSEKRLGHPAHLHQKDSRIEAHIFISFLAYCLYVTLGQRLRALAPGLTPRAVMEKMSSSNGGRAGADDRWAVADSPAAYATGEGPLDASPPVAPTTAGSTSPEDNLAGGRICA